MGKEKKNKRSERASDNPSEEGRGMLDLEMFRGSVGLETEMIMGVFFTFKVGGFQMYDILLTAHGCHQRGRG